MTDRPILFSSAMVLALLAGRKTQTRRILKPQPQADVIHYGWNREGGASWTDQHWESGRLPFWAGDRLWVREAWTARMTHGWTIADARSRMYHEEIIYRADGGKSIDGWWPSIHMPREFSRLTLHVTDVRVERLQDISEGDAIAEGATSRPNCTGFQDRYDGWSMDWSRVGQPSRWARNGRTLAESDISLGSAASAFAGFINELHDPLWNHKGDGIFGANPWVCALTFSVEHANIDAKPAIEVREIRRG